MSEDVKYPGDDELASAHAFAESATPDTPAPVPLAARTGSALVILMCDPTAQLVSQGLKIKRFGAAEHEGWKVERRYSTFQSREVFIAPDGTEYVRTKDPALAEVEIATKHLGVGPLLLRRRSRPFPTTAKEDNE